MHTLTNFFPVRFPLLALARQVRMAVLHYNVYVGNGIFGEIAIFGKSELPTSGMYNFFTKNDTNGIFLHIISNAFGKFLKKGQSNFTKKYLFYEEIDILLNSNFWEKSVKKWGFS